MASPATPASSLIAAADRAGENTAQSTMDNAYSINPPVPKMNLPSSGQDFLDQYQQASSGLQQSYNIPGLLSNVNSLTTKDAQANADSVMVQHYKNQAMQKLPLDDIQSQIDKLTTAKYSVLPQMLARTDIGDPNLKLQMASQLEGQYDNQISGLLSQQDALSNAAEQQAQLTVEDKKSDAQILDKQLDTAKFTLQQAMDGVKNGQTNLKDVLTAATNYQDTLDKRKSAASSGGGNPFLTMMLGNTANVPGGNLPGFDQFVQQQQAAKMQGTEGPPSPPTPQDMATYHQQYDQQNVASGAQANQNQNDLKDIVNQAAVVTSAMPKAQVKQFTDSLTGALQSGNVGLAKQMLEAQKKPLPDKTAESFGGGVAIQQDIQDLKQMYLDAAQKGHIDPVRGTIQQLNPYNEDLKVIAAEKAMNIMNLSHTLWNQALRGPEADQLKKLQGGADMPIGAVVTTLDNVSKSLDRIQRAKLQALAPVYQTMDLQQQMDATPTTNRLNGAPEDIDPKFTALTASLKAKGILK